MPWCERFVTATALVGQALWGLGKVESLGIENLRPAGCTDGDQVGCSATYDIVPMLEVDELVTVNSIDIGTLNCEDLDGVENEHVLQFEVGTEETVHATKIFFGEFHSSSFSSGSNRKIWLGTVIDHDRPVRRTISMTWSSDCSPETFKINMITPSTEGNVETVTSVPCGDVNSSNVCVVKIVRQDEDEIDYDYGPMIAYGEGEPDETEARNNGHRRGLAHLESTKLLQGMQEEAEASMLAARASDPDLDAKDNDIREMVEHMESSKVGEELPVGNGIRHLGSGMVEMPSRRRLDTSDTLDVLVLYTPKAQYEGNSGSGTLRSQSVMETVIAEAFATANAALVTSEAEVQLNLVRVEQVEFTEGSSISSALSALQSGNVGNAHSLRDEYGADLVQLIGFYPTGCGIGYTMTTPNSAFERYAFSVVHSNCINNFSHLHEIGHNMGCNHNYENSNNKDHEFAYAQRHCSGDISTRYRTVMAYSSGCVSTPRVSIFSNPSVTYGGKTAGATEADNARVIRLAKATVANFRESNSLDTPTPVTTSIYPAATPGKYLSRRGCYNDDTEDRAMRAKKSMPPIDGVTIGMKHPNCLSHCINKNSKYRFVGLQNGSDCYCWWNNNKWKKHGKISNDKCDIPCSGQNSKTCGGTLALEVFKIKTADSDEDTLPPMYHGCYCDSLTHSLSTIHHHEEVLGKSARIVQRGFGDIPLVDYEYNSVHECHRHCNIAGYSYFALQFGYLCQCGSDPPGEEDKAEETMCNIECSGSSDNICGGNWHNSVYSVGSPITGTDE